MKTTYYKQCRMCRPTPTGGEMFHIAYIPEKYAVVGKCIKFKRDDDTWSEDFIVDYAADSRRAEQELPDSHNAIKAHRRATGDSMKKESKA